jgi:hypothetical protein
MLMHCLPQCVGRTLAELYPDEPKPDSLSDESWYNVYFGKCADGCPVLERDIERGVELAKKFGWL